MIIKNAVAGDITLKPLEAVDSKAIAVMHREIFPDTPSSKLGANYCREMFRLYAAEKEAFGYVLLGGDEYLGYVVGGGPNAHQMITKKLRMKAIAAFLARPKYLIASVPRVFNAISKRTAGVPKVSPSIDVPTEQVRVAKLFLIGMKESARGTGGAGQLMNAFVSEAFSRGFDRVKLIVYRGNARARAAYEKNGWVLNDKGGESVEYFVSSSLSETTEVSLTSASA